jgi:hypothetical protein
LLANLLRRSGSLLATALVASAAVASLFGPEPVRRIVGSAWFLTGTGGLALAGLLAAVIAISRRSWSSTVQHLGLVVALVGVAVNQTASRSGYLFLEQGAGISNLSLSHNLRRVEELPKPLALDSLTSVSAKAFQPAPVAWVTVANVRSVPVTHNRPLHVAGRQVLVSQVAAPGFLTEYEVALDGTEYLLLHNQVTEPSPGLRLWSFAYDADAARVGLMLGHEQRWLGIGESATVRGRTVRLLSANFAANAGAVFVVNDARYRFIVFLGFGLMLLGLLPPLFRREAQ